MHRLPESLRPVLARPFGPVLPTQEALRAVEGRLLVAVGDVVTQTFLDHGVLPRVMLVDGVTLRGTLVQDALRGLPQEGVRRVTVPNPPATLTGELWHALGEAIASSGSTLITVQGEEDLAALPAMLLAPLDAAVCYGQPGQGVVVVLVTSEVRARASDILHQMEVNQDGH